MSLTAGTGPFGHRPKGRLNFTPPERVVYVEPWPRRVRAFAGDEVVVDSERTVLVYETGRLPRYAFPAEDVSVANLIHVMKTCLKEILQRDLRVRLRPGYFPFVEPGFELDVNCPFCEDPTTHESRGCSVCKRSGWIEVLPCGMVHPNVLRHGGVDPEQYTGFAFGMGLQRVVMLRYGINDIRTFMGGDLRFLAQFVAS